MLDETGDIEIVSGDDEIVQSIHEILSTNAGEWFLNKEHGIHRYDILGQKFNRVDVINIVSEAIFEDDRVRQISSIDVEFDRKTRKLTVKFEIIKKSGDSLEGEVTV